MVRLRPLVVCLVAAMLLTTACAPALRSDRGWTEAADMSSSTGQARSEVVDAPAGPDTLAFSAPEPALDTANTEVPPPQRPPAPTEPGVEAEAATDTGAADAASGWSSFERSLVANLAAGAATAPSVSELVAFERASLAVCAGEATARSAAATHGLSGNAERVLNTFAPAMCHLAPIGDTELPGPMIDAADWATLTERRWRAGAGWIELSTFEDHARRACLGLERSTVMAASTAAQIDALVLHGECALAWNG